MEHDEIVRQRLTLYETACSRCERDPAFRQRLMTSPRPTLNALAEALGLRARVPDGVDITVVESSDRALYLILPPLAEAPLCDTDLARVVGGLGLQGSATLGSDAHGCPACPHPPLFGGSVPRRS